MRCDPKPAGAPARPVLDDPDWRAWAREKFNTREWQPVTDGSWYYLNTPPDHFVHRSVKDPSLLAYIASEADGRRHRVTGTKPGRYLAAHFSSMIPSARDRLAAEFVLPELHIAHTAEEIENVYLKGPKSCMSYETSRYSAHVHPVTAYAGPDLALGYLKRGDEIIARGLCWPERKVYGPSLYGDFTKLRAAFPAAGYQEGSLEGARVRKIENQHKCKSEDPPGTVRYVLPYIDTYGAADFAGEYLTISSKGVLLAGTAGTTGAVGTCARTGRFSANLLPVRQADGTEQVWDIEACQAFAWRCFEFTTWFSNEIAPACRDQYGRTYSEGAVRVFNRCVISGEPIMPVDVSTVSASELLSLARVLNPTNPERVFPENDPLERLTGRRYPMHERFVSPYGTPRVVLIRKWFLANQPERLEPAPQPPLKLRPNPCQSGSIHPCVRTVKPLLQGRLMATRIGGIRCIGGITKADCLRSCPRSGVPWSAASTLPTDTAMSMGFTIPTVPLTIRRCFGTFRARTTDGEGGTLSPGPADTLRST